MKTKKEYSDMYIKRAKDKGFCPICKKRKPHPGKINCQHCLRAAIAYQHRIKIALLDEIMLKQSGKCAITGVPIDWGSWASVDHIIPKCSGGDNSPQNLRLVHKSANLVKHMMSDQEFIDFCCLVADIHRNR